jgi:hypothetical protein
LRQCLISCVFFIHAIKTINERLSSNFMGPYL